MKKKKPINEKTVIESFEFCKEQKSILINRDFRIRFFKHYHFNLVEEVWFKMHDSSIGMSTGKDMEQAIIYVEKDEKKKD